MLRSTFVASVILITSLSLSAQLTSPVNASSSRGAPGVSLSEITTFRNSESVSYQILPYGNDFFLYTLQENVGAVNPFGGGQALNDLLSLRLHRYSENLKRVAEFDVPWPDEQRDHFSLHSLGDRLLWTFATYGGKRGEYNIMAEVLDDKGQLQSEHRLMRVTRDEYAGLVSSTEQSVDQQYRVTVFADESPQRLLSKKDDERATLTIAVFDNVGEVVSLEKKTLRCARDQLDIQSVAVGNDGTAYVLAKIFGNSKRRETRGGSDSKVYIYSLAPGAEELKKTELKLAGQYIEGISIVPGREGVPAVAGVYTDRIGGRIQGYFSTDNPSSGEVLKPIPFEQKMLAELGRRITSKRRGALVFEGQFEFRDAIRLSDGNLSILLESFDIRYDNTNPGTIGFGGVGGVQQPTYIYGEGVILNFDQNGDLGSALVVPKYQSTNNSNTPFYRMNLVEYKRRAAVIYNDNPKNFTRDTERRTRGLVLGKALAMVAYEEEGSGLARDPLFGRLDADKLILIPSSATRLSNDDVVFLAMRYKTFGKNQLRFGRVRE